MKARPEKKKSHLKPSKTEDFLERVKTDNSMIEYITQLRIMNPASTAESTLNKPRREGRYVRLAHARDEFTAPVLTKGKSVARAQKRRKTKKRV